MENVALLQQQSNIDTIKDLNLKDITATLINVEVLPVSGLKNRNIL